MKNAHAKRAKILFSIVKYANLWGLCCRRRSGCLSSLIIGMETPLCSSLLRDCEIIISRGWGRGRLKNEPHIKKYYLVPSSNVGNFSSDPFLLIYPKLWPASPPYGGDTLSVSYLIKWSNPFLWTWICPCCFNKKNVKMSCDQVGELLTALILVSVSSLFYFWWHTKSSFIDVKPVPKNKLVSLLVRHFSQLAHKKKTKKKPVITPWFSYRNLHATALP